jgi:hypothetical protein
MATVGTEGRADQPTGTTGEVLMQATEVQTSPCGNPKDVDADLSEENLPPQTDLMRQIAEKDGGLNGSIAQTKECMTKQEGCGYWFVNPHEALDGEENEGAAEAKAIQGYSRSLPEYIITWKNFEQKRYHESAETVTGLTMRNATDESEAQTALATKLQSMADHFRALLKSGGSRIYPYHDLPVTVSSLDEYARIARKRAKILSIVACHTKLLAEKDHKLEEELREKLKSLVTVDLEESPAEEKPAVQMGNSGIDGQINPANTAPAASWEEEVTRSFDAYRVARNPAAKGMIFTEEDSLFVRVNHQMRKREVPGLLGPLPLGSERLRLNQEFQLERY